MRHRIPPSPEVFTEQILAAAGEARELMLEKGYRHVQFGLAHPVRGVVYVWVEFCHTCNIIHGYWQHGNDAETRQEIEFLVDA